MQSGVLVRRLALRLQPDCGSYCPSALGVRGWVGAEGGEGRELRTAHPPPPARQGALLLELLKDVPDVSCTAPLSNHYIIYMQRSTYN